MDLSWNNDKMGRIDRLLLHPFQPCISVQEARRADKTLCSEQEQVTRVMMNGRL